MRTFIAIELPEAVKTSLGALVDRLRGAGVRVSWVKPESMHLTLRFLGDIDAEHVDQLRAILHDAYKGIVPFTLSVRETGAFPNPRRPSVIWVGVEPLEGGLATVQMAAESAARAIGLPPEDRPFHPHLTLARIKDSGTAGPLMACFEQERGFDAGDFAVGSVSLFSSQLTPHGPIHRCEQEFPF
jgi:2'-5' RNA ligase